MTKDGNTKTDTKKVWNSLTRLRATAEIARNAGVEEEEILDSVEKIDEFFL